MPKGYHHLTYEQRCQIYALNEISKSQNEIAKILGVHRSSISREIKRNSSLGIYTHEKAQNNSILRRSKKYQRKKILNEPTIKAIENTLKLKQWSPQQISGRLKKMVYRLAMKPFINIYGMIKRKVVLYMSI